jgi:hypothetical protein
MKERCLARLTVVAIAVASSSLLPAMATTIKPGDPGVCQYGNSLYTYVLGPKWTEAEANAVAIGGHLVTWNTLEEAQWGLKTFSIGGDCYDEPSGMWNGLNDLQDVGVWRWVSGEPLTYTGTGWGVDQPDFIGFERYVGGFTGWGNANIDGVGLTDVFKNGALYMRGLAEIPYASPHSTAAPGPQPIFGAAAAFGYSRKLRKRIKSQP